MESINLVLLRKWRGDDWTQGELYLNGKLECYTLEDTVREDDIKLPGRTAIPAGCYEIAITESPRFKNALLPLLLDVPNFTWIRMHAGNDPEDTDGCILVGSVRAKGAVLSSRVALDKLMEKLKGKSDIRITIINDWV
ncbi:MAG: DUF5675 family protein [Bacteroidales bacterium]|jgi:hypothetical protein